MQEWEIEKFWLPWKVGGCVSPHPRQRGRCCFDWSHNTRVKTQPVCPVLLCSAPQARNSTAPGKNYPQHFQAYASESRSWPHSIIVYMYKVHCILLSPVWSRYWLYKIGVWSAQIIHNTSKTILRCAVVWMMLYSIIGHNPMLSLVSSMIQLLTKLIDGRRVSPNYYIFLLA